MGQEVVKAPEILPKSTVCLDLLEGWEELAPVAEIRLSLAEVRMLLRAILPQPSFDAAAALELLIYQQRNKAAAYRSHRRRRLRRLDQLRFREVSL